MRDSAKLVDPVVSFFYRLSSSLEVLGPAETREIVAEMRSHLAELVADNAGDERAAIAALGDPEDLAHRILEERGYLAFDKPVFKAPRWSRVSALALDLLVLVVLIQLLVVFPLGSQYWTRLPSYVIHSGLVADWVLAALWLSLLIWWWAWKRRRHGHVSYGMRLMGLRRVRMASSYVMVEVRAIPGLADLPSIHAHPSRRSIWPLFVVGLLVWTMVGNTTQVIAEHDDAELRQEHELTQSAVWDTSSAIQCVSDVYNAVLGSDENVHLEDYFAPQALSALRDLKARIAAGGVAWFSVSSVDIPGYTNKQALPSADKGVVAIISIAEYAKGSREPVVFEYAVRISPSTLAIFRGESPNPMQITIEACTRYPEGSATFTTTP